MTQQEAAVEVAQHSSTEVVEQTRTMVASTPALQKMAAEAAALETAFKMAQSLSKTTAVPQRYQQDYVPKNKREPQGITAAYNLAAAIMYGAELGMSALQSAQNVFDVHGQPAVYARTMVAQVRSWIDQRVAAGQASNDPDTGDSIWEVSAAPTKVVWAGRRAGKTASAEWTPERAEQAGFTKNEKYQKQPIEMLRAKAMTEVCRILFQDVLLGMAYSVEELQLEQGVSVQVVRPASSKKGVGGLHALLDEREAQRAVASEPHPAAPAPGDDSVEQAPLPEPEPQPQPQSESQPEPVKQRGKTQAAAKVNSQGEEFASKAQLDAVTKLLKTERFDNPNAPDALALLGQIIGRDLENVRDLSATDADEIASVLSAQPGN